MIVIYCVGGCGKSWDADDKSGWGTHSIICEVCYIRLYGEPADGFTGFADDGSHRTVGRK